MPKRIENVTRDYLVNAELPAATKTYTVISHEFVINTVKEKLADKGFTVVDEKYRCTGEAKVATGVFELLYDKDPDLGLMFAFANSYDKSLKFRCAIGSYVKRNKATIIQSDSSSWTRKHTGTADTETVETIETLVDDAFVYFDQLKDSKERMKNVTITREDFSKLIGVLFVNLGVINTEQISLIKQELDKPSYQYSTDEDSLWTKYNHILVALKKSHPKYWMEQQKLVHLHMMTQLDMIEFDQKVDGPVANIPVKDPNQIDLEDMITEVEQEKAVVKMEDIALTPDELSEQLYGVNNNEEEITMTAHVETDEEYNARVAEIEGGREEEVEIEGETVVLPGFTSTGPTKVVERNEAGEPLTSVTFGIMEYGEKVAEEELPLPLSHIPDGMAMKEEQQEFNWEIAGEQKEEPVVDLDQEEDDDWDQLEAAGVITKSGSDFDIDKVQSEEESVFELPKAPGLHEEMREMDQAIQDDSDNIPQLNASNRGDEVEIERVAEKPGTIQEAFDIPEMPAPDTATEDEDTSDDLVVEEQSTGDTVEDLSSEEFFISEMDLGMSPEPGETVTIGDDYYYVDRRTELDGVPGYTLMGVTEEAEEEEEVTQLSQEEIVQQIAEDEAAVAEVCDKPSEEPDPVEDSEPEEEFEIADAPGQRSINVLGNNLPNGTVTDVEEEEEVVDASEQFNKLIENREQEEKNSRIKEAISKQITELYGVPQEFSFIEGAGQYNVTLETGESFVIDAGVVNSAISNLNV